MASFAGERQPITVGNLRRDSSDTEASNPVTVTGHGVSYEDPEDPSYEVNRTLYQVGDNGTAVFVGGRENTSDVLTHMPEGCVPIGTSAIEVLKYVMSKTNNPDLARLFVSLVEERYTQETIDYMDSVCAAMCIDANGNPLDDMNINALGEVLAALLGDEEKQIELAFKIARLRDHRRLYEKLVIERQKNEMVEHLSNFPRAAELPELSPKNVVLVHVTKHQPSVDEHGNVILYPTANYDGATGDDGIPRQRTARGTIHFTVNSRVEDHILGDGWEGDDNYVVVAALGSVLDGGTSPVAVNDVDTYFESNPGQPLILPNAILLAPIKGETLDENKKRVEEAMLAAGAEDTFSAGPHYLESHTEQGGKFANSNDFSIALYMLCVRLGLPRAPLHNGTPDHMVETAFYGDGFVEPGDVNPTSFIQACSANQRWAACNGLVPIANRLPAIEYSSM